MTPTRRIPGVLALLLVGACGEGPTHVDPATDGSAASGLDRYLEALCDFQERFEAETGKVTPSRQECEAVWRDAAACDPRMVDVDDGVFEACASWLDGVRDRTAATTSPDASCKRLWLGETAVIGEACNLFEGELCDVDLHCEVLAPGPGRCTTCKAMSEVGEACNVGNGPADYQPCRRGAFCSSGTCRAMQAVGAACDGGIECESGLCASGSCAARPAPGEACDAADLCPVDTLTGVVFLPCCEGAFRSCIDGTCQDRRAAGEVCSVDADCLNSHLCDRGTCTFFSECAKRTEDEPCTGDTTCDPALYCDFNDGEPRCRPRVAVGANCSRAQCADRAYCDLADFVCKSDAVEGESCAGYAECIAGLFCDDTRVCRSPGELGASCTTYEGCTSQHCDLDLGECVPPSTSECTL